jgi:alpha-amylase
MMIEYLKDLISCGVKGFRFDAAKHIELPKEAWCGSDFWERTLKDFNKEDLFMYGEVLDSDTWLVDKYCKYMNVGVNNGQGTDKSKLVQWTFSHDDALTFNLRRNEDWNVILDEWEWKLRENKASHMLFYPTSDLWRTQRMKYINNKYR